MKLEDAESIEIMRAHRSPTTRTIGASKPRPIQYADDTTGVLKDDASLKALLDVIEDFEKISGLKINTSKSECMGIGEARGRKGDFFGLKWPERPIKCLGVYLNL